MHKPYLPDDVISQIQKAVEEEAEALHLSLDHPHIVKVKADLLSAVVEAERIREEMSYCPPPPYPSSSN